jgi:hypothetical protein
MGSYSKGTWLLIGFVMTAMLLLIGIIEVRIPSGRLSTELMLGVTVLGYGSIFAWLYLQRAPSKPQNQLRSLRLVRRVDALPIYESSALDESLGAHVAAQKSLENRYN